ncbi:MAG: chemotaxis protein CheA, partial [Thermodesulfobacteriota bacterium]|nr:chemotaxis protein CheA [Thermodesulfobacteriota bacterium]
PAETTPAPETGAYDVSRDQDLFFGFITESMEHIETIEVNIVSLEQDPEDKDTINSIFRPFHTIKGVAGFLNLHRIHRLTHEVENILDDARNDRLKVTTALTDLVLDAVDIVKKMIIDLQGALETGEKVDVDYGEPAFIDRIHALQQGDLPPDQESEVYDYGGQRLGEILVAQGLLTEDELEDALEAREEGRLRRLGDILVERGVINADELEDALWLQLENPDKKLGRILAESGKAEPKAIAEALSEQDALGGRKLGEVLIRGKKAGGREVAGALREQKKAAKGRAAVAAQTIKVDTAKLDNLVDMVGELVIAQSLVTSNERVDALKDQKRRRNLGHVARITSDLQRTAMGMRMVPIRQTFQKMIRLVRDLSRKSGKRVGLDMSGEETEIDRNMVEEIYDPMVHMIRNSVDHGVETPQERLNKGKPAEGRIQLRAFHQGGNVIIEIEDDGQGLNRDKILAKAIERGLADADENLPDGAIFNLIFHPGFSTADKVTDVSGRGVGMDVVKKAIDKLRGKVEVHSEPERGSIVTIRLPLTLAIIDGMIVRVGENRYILPTTAIHESFRPRQDECFTVKGRGEMIKVRGSLLPLIRLAQVLGNTTALASPAEEALAVVLENEGERRCVMVDEILGKQEVVIKSLGEGLKNIPSLAGGSILGDGRVGLILDVTGLFAVSDDFVPSGPVGVSDKENSG